MHESWCLTRYSLLLTSSSHSLQVNFYQQMICFFYYINFIEHTTWVLVRARSYIITLFGIFKTKIKYHFDSQNFKIFDFWYSNFWLWALTIFGFHLNIIDFLYPSRKQFHDFQYWCLTRYPFWLTSSSHSLQLNFFQQIILTF